MNTQEIRRKEVGEILWKIAPDAAESWLKAGRNKGLEGDKLFIYAIKHLKKTFRLAQSPLFLTRRSCVRHHT